MRSLFLLLSLFILLPFFSCQPIETLELEPNILDDPNFELFSSIDSVEYVNSGIPNVRNFYVYFSISTDALNAAQLQQITGYRLYENDQEVALMGLTQRRFYRKNLPVGTALDWQIAPAVGDESGKRSNSLSYTVQ